MPRRLLIPLSLLLLATRLPPASAGELRPCETCRDSTCPFLKDLPPCPEPEPRRTPPPKPKPPVTTTPTKIQVPPQQPKKPITTTTTPEPPVTTTTTPEPPVTTASRSPPITLEPDAIRSQGGAGPPLVSDAPRPLRRAALGVGIAGLLLTAGGGTLLGLDRRYGEGCWAPGDVSTCAQVYLTQPHGAALAAVGGGALVAAVVLFAIDARRGGRPQASLRVVSPGP